MGAFGKQFWQLPLGHSKTATTTLTKHINSWISCWKITQPNGNLQVACTLFSSHELGSQSMSPLEDCGLPLELEGDILSDGLPKVSECIVPDVVSMLGPSSMGISPGSRLMCDSNSSILFRGLHAI